MKIIVLGAILLAAASTAGAQGKKEYRYAVSYVSASVVYVDAGREQHIAIGDTLRITRSGKILGAATVTAVSVHSCAAQPQTQQQAFAVGDSALIVKPIPVERPHAAVIAAKDSASAANIAPEPRGAVATPSRTENIVSGRFGLQYAGVIAEDSRFNYSQPSALFRLDIANVYGTGTAFTMYSRNYYDLSDNYNRYGETSRLKNRVYELSLQQDLPDGAFGYGLGRMTSHFVGGLGTFDGAQVYVRQNNITAGIIYGAKVGDRVMEVDGDDRKGALFVNYKSGSDFLHQYDGTIAYARQLYEGKLDREFVYLQNSLMLGSALSMYESSEMELNDISNGVRTPALSLSNTFLSVSYYPGQWFSANLGYDATRSVYLFETMKEFPDTLFDKNIMQGFRAGTNFRLPYFMSLSLNGSYRTKKGDERNSYKLDATFRMSDIAGSDVSAGLRYSDIAGVYTNGKNWTLDLDRTFFRTLSVSMRYDYYAYSITALSQSYITQTITANLNYRISRALYSSLSVDRVIDATMNSYRMYGEIGIRF